MKVVHGDHAIKNAFNYMAVFLEAGTSSKIRGGGTISTSISSNNSCVFFFSLPIFFKPVSTTAILTAAHVLIDRDNQWIQSNKLVISVARDDLKKG